MLSAFFLSLAFAASKAKPIPSPTPLLLPSPAPIASVRPQAGFLCIECTEGEKAKLQAAQGLANRLLPSPCFRSFLEGWGLIDTQGKTASQVVDHLAGASLTVPVHYYRGRCRVVGYRNPGAPDLYFNRCHHDAFNACQTASNALHEWSHVLGYTHPFKATSTRGRTVPYAINRAIEACCTNE